MMKKREVRSGIKKNIFCILSFFLSFFLSFVNAGEIEDKLNQAQYNYTQYILGCKDCIDRAIEIYSSIISGKSANNKEINRAKIGLVFSYYAKKEYSKAVEILEDVLKSEDLTEREQEKVLYQLGYIKYLMGKYGEAIEIFKKLKNDYVYKGQASKVPYGVYMWGRCLEAEGNTEAARIKYREVITNYPEHPAVQYAEKVAGE
ncbi:MAG: tetratricopeptide repeat protein [Elusimicrobiales bacterium]|nr:tetratricopeptide repeat protein [Elusimicrobiales bacterium]